MDGFATSVMLGTLRDKKHPSSEIRMRNAKAGAGEVTAREAPSRAANAASDGGLRIAAPSLRLRINEWPFAPRAVTVVR